MKKRKVGTYGWWGEGSGYITGKTAKWESTNLLIEDQMMRERSKWDLQGKSHIEQSTFNQAGCFDSCQNFQTKKIMANFFTFGKYRALQHANCRALRRISRSAQLADTHTHTETKVLILMHTYICELASLRLREFRLCLRLSGCRFSLIVTTCLVRTNEVASNNTRSLI